MSLLITIELARKDREAAAKLSTDVPWLRALPERPEILLEDYEIPDGDRWFHEDPERMAAILDAAREAVRQGPWGVAWDYVAYLTPWGFALEDISIEFHIWHGAQDTIMAGEDVEFWASRIPRSIVTVWPDAGHMVVSSIGRRSSECSLRSRSRYSSRRHGAPRVTTCRAPRVASLSR